MVPPDNSSLVKHGKNWRSTYADLDPCPHMQIGGMGIKEYIVATQMDQDSTWGSEVEVMTLTHLLDTSN